MPKPEFTHVVLHRVRGCLCDILPYSFIMLIFQQHLSFILFNAGLLADEQKIVQCHPDCYDNNLADCFLCCKMDTYSYLWTLCCTFLACDISILCLTDNRQDTTLL